MVSGSFPRWVVILRRPGSPAPESRVSGCGSAPARVCACPSWCARGWIHPGDARGVAARLRDGPGRAADSHGDFRGTQTVRISIRTFRRPWRRMAPGRGL